MLRIPRALRFAAAMAVAVSATLLVPSAAQAYPGQCSYWFDNTNKFGALCDIGSGSFRVVGFCEDVRGLRTKVVYGPWVSVGGVSRASCPGAYPDAYDVSYEPRAW
jgi:hypothetical protein